MNQVPYRHIELIDKRNITSNLDNLIHSISSFINETILHAPNRIRSNNFNYAFASQSAATSNPNIFLVQQASTPAATHVDAQTTSTNEPSPYVPTDDNFIFDLHSSTATSPVGMLIIPPPPKIAVANDAAKSTGQPIWRYVYNAYFPNQQPLPGLRAYHSSEIFEIFGTYNQHGATQQQIQLSNFMQTAWANFAKNPSGGPGWNSISSGTLGELGANEAANCVTGNTFNYAFASQLAVAINSNLFLGQQRQATASNQVNHDAETALTNVASPYNYIPENFILNMESTTAISPIGMLVTPPPPTI
ncbi:unnamed protein product [Adineta steineri]|nr:unnamed protein product [Adineta steineri]CAF1661789.1 unnamed protein product [Adineta steineri]